MTSREILVAGATGQQGGAVARSLLKRGFTVRGLTRDPGKRPANSEPEIQWVRGDLQDPASLGRALQGAEGFFIVTTPFTGGFGVPPDVAGEVRAGTTALEAAKSARTPHVVLSTVMGIRGRTEPIGVPHLDSKITIEQRARALGVPITILRPSFFMENLLQPWSLGPVRAGQLSLPVRPTTRISMVAVRDIGEIAARAFEEPGRRIGTEVDLQGDTKTYTEVVEQLSARLGVPARFVEMSDADALRQFGADMQRMYRGFDRGMPQVDIAALERDWNIHMTRLADLLKDAPV